MARRDVNGNSARCGRARASDARVSQTSASHTSPPKSSMPPRRSLAVRGCPERCALRAPSNGERTRRRARPGLRRAHSSSARSRRAHPVRGPRAPGAPGRREGGARALRTTAPFPLENDRCAPGNAPGNAPVRRSSRASRRRLHRLHRPRRPRRPHRQSRGRTASAEAATRRRAARACAGAPWAIFSNSNCRGARRRRPLSCPRAPLLTRAPTRRARAATGLYARRACACTRTDVSGGGPVRVDCAPNLFFSRPRLVAIFVYLSLFVVVWPKLYAGHHAASLSARRAAVLCAQDSCA